jgi:plastocyanin
MPRRDVDFPRIFPRPPDGVLGRRAGAQLCPAPADDVQMRVTLTRAALSLACGLAAGAEASTLEVQALGTDGKPLAEAAVYLESAAARAAVRPAQGVEIEQAGRRFTHRVTVVPVGSELRFPNRDTVRHHVYSFSPAKTFELKLYAGTPASPVLFDKAGVAVLGCNIHDTMVAWVVVVETPYFGLADGAGKVHLDNVPAGSYRLRTWHPALAPGAAASDEDLALGAGTTTVTVHLPVTGARP